MAQNEPDDWVEVKHDDPGDWVEVNAAPQTEKDKINQRVGPPSAADIAVLRDINPLSSLGYAASEVPIAAPIMNRAIRAVSPKTEDELELAKARYEQENPKMSSALGIAAPMALPLGPAKLGAQALYQGGVSAADTLLKGGGAGEATTGGALTAGTTAVLGRAGQAVVPYLRRGGSAFDKVGERVADYLGNKASKRAADAVLGGQTRLNRSLNDEGKQNVGRVLLDKGLMDKKLGQAPAALAARVDAAKNAANGEITNMINEFTERGINPTKEQVIRRIEALKATKDRSYDNAPFHNYMDGQLTYLESIPEGEMTLRKLQDIKNEVPYDKMSEQVIKKARKAFSNNIQDVQTNVIENAGHGPAYRALQDDASGLINASKGATERANRFATNRSPGLTDYITGGVGAVAGSALGSNGGDNIPGGALGGMAGAAALGSMNRYGRSRGSSMMAANLNTLSKMFRTKFGPTLEAAAQRGKGAIGVTHALLYQKNPEYRMLYDQEENQ